MSAALQYVALDTLNASVGARLLSELGDASEGVASDAEVIAQINREAAAIIESYLGGVYVVPFQKSPLIEQLTIDLMRLRLFLRRDQGALSDTVKALEERTYKTLEEIRDGRITLHSELLVSDAKELGLQDGETVVGDLQGNVRYRTNIARFPRGFITAL